MTLKPYYLKAFTIVVSVFLSFPQIVIANDEIKIGVILHLTGDLAMPSAAFREGIELAVLEENQLGVRGQKLKVILEDGRNNPKVSHTAAQKLIKSDKVDVAIISSYLDAMSSGPSFEKAGLPVITLWDSNPEIDSLGEYIFAIGPWTPSSGEVAAQFAKKELKAKTAVVVSNQDSWSRSVADYFELSFKSLGGRIIETQTLNPDTTDFRSVLTKIKSSNPDVIYSPLVHNVVPFYKQLKQISIKSKIISSDIIADEHLNQAVDAFEGIYQTNLKDPDSAIYEQLQASYYKNYGRQMSLGWFVAVGYDSVKVFTNAMRNVGFNPGKIKDQLYRLNNFNGASSKIEFTTDGSSPQVARMFKVVKGEFVLLDISESR